MLVWYPTGISVSGVNQGLHILYKEPTTTAVDIYWTILYRGRAIYTCVVLPVGTQKSKSIYHRYLLFILYLIFQYLVPIQ